MRTRVSQRQRRRARAFFSCRTGFLARANSQPYAQCVASRRYATFLLSDTSLRPVRSSLLTVKASSHGPAFRQAAVRACDGLVRARRDDPIVFITREPKSRARFFENFAALRSCRPETMGRLRMTLPIIDIAPLIRARDTAGAPPSPRRLRLLATQPSRRRDLAAGPRGKPAHGPARAREAGGRRTGAFDWAHAREALAVAAAGGIHDDLAAPRRADARLRRRRLFACSKKSASLARHSSNSLRRSGSLQSTPEG
jgi:hypothetical protein